MALCKRRQNDPRPLQTQQSDLAHRLWEARNCPTGSPDIDWFKSEELLRDFTLNSPFDEFLREAEAAWNRTSLQHGVSNDPEYARVIEERRYVSDILDRVETLAFAYARLSALSELFREAEAEIRTTQRVVRDEPLTFEVPDEIEWQRDLRALEGRALSGIHLLRGNQLVTHVEGFESQNP